MSVRRVVVVASIVVAGMVPFAGGAGAAKPLTKAQFITEANALCAASRAAFAPLESQFAGLKTNPTPQAIAAFVSALSTIVQKQINKTRALTPPKAEQAQVTKFLRDAQTELNMVKADPQLMGGPHSPFLTADTLARKLGLEGAPGSGVCTKPQG